MRCASILHRSQCTLMTITERTRTHLDEDESVPSISGDYYLSSTPLNESLDCNGSHNQKI